MVNGDKGGLWDTSSMGGESWAIFYVQVDDVKAADIEAIIAHVRAVVRERTGIDLEPEVQVMGEPS